MAHRKVFMVLFIFEANCGVAVKRDHHSLFSHPSQFVHNHHFEITVLTVMTIEQRCINSGRPSVEIKFYAVALSLFCRGNGVLPRAFRKGLSVRLLSFGAESYVFQVAIQKFVDPDL
jgi:hypothetical protein